MLKLTTTVLNVTNLIPGFSTVLAAVPRYMLNNTAISMFTSVTVANVGLITSTRVSCHGSSVMKLTTTLKVNMSRTATTLTDFPA